MVDQAAQLNSAVSAFRTHGASQRLRNAA